MQTRDAMTIYANGDYNKTTLGGRDDGPLAAVGHKFLAAFEEREAARMEEAAQRDALRGMEAPLAALQRLVARYAGESLTSVDNRLPAMMTADAYDAMFAASREIPGDRGLRTAAGLLQERWKRDPMGVLSIGDVHALRAHVLDRHPKSRIAQVIDATLPVHGYHNLDLAPLVRIAAQVKDQESYERLVEAHGLDGADGAHIRARAFIMAVAGLADEAVAADAGTTPSTTPSLEDRVHARLTAQMAPPAAPGAPAPDAPDAPMEAPSTNEPDMPLHDEQTEEGVSVTSPITGEDLVLELGVALDDGANADDASAASGGGDDMAGFAPVGQLQDTFGPGPDDMDGGAEPGPPETHSDVTVTMIEDPSAPGSMLEVTLAPVEEGPEEGLDAPMSAPPAPAPALGMGEGDIEPAATLHKEGPERHAARASARASSRGRESFLIFAAADSGTWPIEAVEAPSLTAVLQHLASRGVDGEVFVNAERGEAVIALAGAVEETYLHVAKAKEKRKKLPSAKSTFTPGVNQQPKPQTYAPKTVALGAGGKVLRGSLSRDDVALAAEVLGIEHARVEAALLDGRRVCAEHACVQILADDSVELAVAHGEKTARLAGRLAKLDDVIRDFQATAAAAAVSAADGSLAASTLSTRPLFRLACACGAQNEYIMPSAALDVGCGCGRTLSAAKVAEALTRTAADGGARAHDYVLLIEVPEPVNASLSDAQRRLRSARIKSTVTRMVPKAEFDLDGATLGITLRSADTKTLNAVERTLRTAFGVREMVAGEIEAGGDSPFVGETPTTRQPAGAPSAPMTAPQQAAHVGAGAQQNFVNTHTDPLDKGKAKLPTTAAAARSRRGQFAPPSAPPSAPPMGGGGGSGGFADAPAPGLPPGMGEDGRSALPPLPESMMGEGGQPGGTGEGAQAPELDEQQETIVYSALRFFHQTEPYAGELELAAMFTKKFSDLMEQLAPQKSPGRRLLEQKIGGMIREVLAEPVLVFQGAMPDPGKINQQQDDWVSVSSELGGEEGEALPRPKVNQQPKPQTYAPKKPGKLGPDSSEKDVGSFGAKKPSSDGHVHVTTYARNPDEKPGKDMMTGENDMTRRMDQVSSDADGALRSR